MRNGKLKPGPIAKLTGLSPDIVDESLSLLIENRYISIFTPEDSVTLIDKYIKEEHDLISANNAPMTSTELTKLRKTLVAKRKREFDENIVPDAKKRVFEFEDILASKKIRLDGNCFKVPLNATFFINFERFHIEKRNDDICLLATKSINESSGMVMKGFLDMLISNMYHIKEEKSSKLSTLTV